MNTLPRPLVLALSMTLALGALSLSGCKQAGAPGGSETAQRDQKAEDSRRQNGPAPADVAGTSAATSSPKPASTENRPMQPMSPVPVSEAPADVASSEEQMRAASEPLAAQKKDLMIATDEGTVAVTDPTAGETYAKIQLNPVQRVSEQPVSTFAIDVDTGSYSNVRRMLNGGYRPPQDAVRAEELINYFDYAYPLPQDRSIPFSLTTEMSAAPWNPARQLLLIGLKGYEVPASEIPKTNLVFLLDVSGSMEEPDKLPLLKQSLSMLVEELDSDDSVAIVVYAGAAGMVLPPTPGNQRERILAALGSLSAGGSTNGGEGIELAYALARQAYIQGGINRVILATDGDFNVGTADVQSLKSLVEAKRKDGISLTTLGFGQGNYNDAMAEQLANVGNGNHYYIDSVDEARKVLVEERTGTLFTIAKDVKIQIEFNPAQVAEYRLIGYENRLLAREDFDNDAKDAGEIGAGHEVTALYEIALVGSGGEQLPPLRYAADAPESKQFAGELAHLKLRYKLPDGDRSRLLEHPIKLGSVATDSTRIAFAAAVAGFAEVLRGGGRLGEFGLAEVADLAERSRGADPQGHRAEFAELVRKAAAL